MSVDPLEGVRETLTRAAPAQAPAILDTLTEAMKATKSAWGTCGHCKRRVQVEVQDSAAAVRAATAFIDYTDGRPPLQGDDSDATPSLSRAVYATVDAATALALLDAGDLEALRAELASSL